VEIERLRELIALLKEEGLTEITVWEGEERCTIRQAPPGGTPPAPSPKVAPAAAGTFTLTAPLVGTFFSRPSPDDEPFVSPGETVSVGDTVGIIEAMKVLNEIKAERAGRLVRVLVEDGTPVEYGQALFVFEPA